MKLYVYSLLSKTGDWASAVVAVMAENQELAHMAADDAIKDTDWKFDDRPNAEPVKVYGHLEPHLEEFYI